MRKTRSGADCVNKPGVIVHGLGGGVWGADSSGAMSASGVSNQPISLALLQHQEVPPFMCVICVKGPVKHYHVGA